MGKEMVRTTLCVGLLASCLVLLPVFSGSAFASTTPGSLTLSSTFDSISVRASFTGDPNGNNSASIQFRRQGETTWRNAFTPIVDRRTSISGHTNPYVNQARGSIVGLQAGTTYEVALTFADPDGIVGSATLTKSVATISPAAPVSGAQLFVDAGASSGGNGSSASPFNSIPAAVSAATAGTTIQVRPGTYPPFTISKAGTASGYIAIVGDARDQVLISGGGGNNINVSGSFIQLKNLRLRQSNNSSINVQSNSHHIWIENIYHENISASRSYGDAGVLIGDNTHNVYVLSNEFYSQSLTDFDIPGDAWDQAGAAIYINSSPNSQGTFVFKGNIIKAGFRDCIGNSTESWGNGTIDNSDIAYNYVTGCKDDAIQMEATTPMRQRCRGRRPTSFGFTTRSTRRAARAPATGSAAGARNPFSSSTTTSSGPPASASIVWPRPATPTAISTSAAARISTIGVGALILRSAPCARRPATKSTASRATRSSSTCPN